MNILHIRISLVTKFQLKLTILIFFTKFDQREFPVENRKIALVRASMVVTYYIKLFRMGDQQTQRYFNVSSPSSRRDNKPF